MFLEEDGDLATERDFLLIECWRRGWLTRLSWAAVRATGARWLKLAVLRGWLSHLER